MDQGLFLLKGAWRWLTLAGFAVAIAGSGCTRSSHDVANTGNSRYRLRGEIIAVNPGRNTLTVSHEAIPGLMPAMVMEYRASEGDLAASHVGERIRADLVRQGDDYLLENVWPDDRVSTALVATASNALRQDTAARGGEAYRELGDEMPDFALYDQDGRVVEARRFRGRQIMLNFIYTRCPVASMCPAATERMMAVQRAARAAGIANLQIVSITLDPEHDTPGTLEAYARAHGIDTSNFTFLTGPERAIRDLLTQFGVIAEFKDGLIRHTLATLLIDPDGRIIHRADGSEWTVAEFVDRMKKVADGSGTETASLRKPGSP